MILYCIRHGESVFNSQGRIQGQADPPLSELGRRQSQALGRALARAPIAAVFASPLRRAYETAEAVATALQLPIRVNEALMEINVGIFQGKRWDEIADEFPEEAARWKSHDPDYVIPQGESRRQLMKRLGAAFGEIRRTCRAEGIQEAAVVAHGGALSAAFKELLEIPAARNPFSLVNSGVCKLEWPADDLNLKLLTVNDVEHLRGLEIEARDGDLG